MNNNLFLDFHNKAKIPQNETSDYQLIKSKDWKNVIDLFLNINDPIDYFNLYIIIKSYATSLIYPFTEILTRVIKLDDMVITERIDTYLIQKMSYLEFQKWAEFRVNSDLKYCNSGDFYSFSFVSNHNIVKDSDLFFLKPMYPWNETVLNEIKSIELKEAISEKQIFLKNKKLALLRNENIRLKKLIIRLSNNKLKYNK